MDALIERYTSTMLAKAKTVADKTIAVNERMCARCHGIEYAK